VAEIAPHQAGPLPTQPAPPAPDAGLPTPGSPQDVQPAPHPGIAGGGLHTIPPDALTISGPQSIDSCQTVTYTIAAVNDAVTATNVVLVDTMPAGFVPTQRVCSFPVVRPNQVVTCVAVFSVTCDAVSGQNTATLTQDGGPTVVERLEVIVNPGSITLRKSPEVIPAYIDDVVTWTVYVESTGYGPVSNVVVTDVLGAGLQYVGGVTSTFIPFLPTLRRQRPVPERVRVLGNRQPGPRRIARLYHNRHLPESGRHPQRL
jgi:uncharacterized repeat protein (TIGR01451 family)